MYTQPEDLSSFQTGDYSYSDQCSVFSKTAFVQIGPQTCNHVQKRGGFRSGRFSIIFARRVHRERRAKRVRAMREPHAAEPRRAQRARSRIESDERIESGERSESARCASPTRRGERSEPATFCSKPLHAQDQSRRYLRSLFATYVSRDFSLVTV